MSGIVPALASLAGWALAIPVALPLGIFSAEVIAGLRPTRGTPAAASAGTVAILIPAHDEAEGIEKTLTALGDVASPATRIVVVADNCTDETASLARAAGATVVERKDPQRRGKGFALARGRDFLAEETGSPPETVIVLDADCRLAPGSIEALVAASSAHDAPAQAVNLIAPDREASPLVQISSFAVMVKNLYRSRGMQRLGGAALLTGTGMAFPWRHFAAADLATGAIVEDLSLGIALTRAGHPPRLVEDARVTSAPAQLGDALVQRTRWEHGFLATLRDRALPVLWSGIRRGSRAEIALGLHLLVPSLALLLLLGVGVLLLAAAAAALGAGLGPAALVAGALTAALTAAFLAWLGGGRTVLSAAGLIRAPLYVMWKLPLYLGFIRRPETRWQRTPRN